LKNDHLDDACAAREDQPGQGQMQSRADAVGADHDPPAPLATETVSPDAPEQDQRDHRQRLRGQHEAEVGCRPGPLGHI
jgi:hypothetical protein